MADLRTSKTARQCDKNDLLAYNIEFKPQVPPTFFETDSLPAPQLKSEALLTAEDGSAQIQPISPRDQTRTILDFLDLADEQLVSPETRYTTNALLFVNSLFSGGLKGYTAEDGSRFTSLFHALWYHICGDFRNAGLRAVLVDASVSFKEVVLSTDDAELGMIRMDNRKFRKLRDNPSARTVASAIAAFDVNNKWRKRTEGQETLDERVMPAYYHDRNHRSTPMFLKVPVTKEWARHLNEGTYPLHYGSYFL